LQIQRTCSALVVGATGAAIGMAVALVAASEASDMAEKRIARTGFRIEASTELIRRCSVVMLA
jgi:hypothetical protein